MCFVDFKKAFDSISYDKLWVTMMDVGYHLICTQLAGQTVQETAR